VKMGVRTLAKDFRIFFFTPCRVPQPMCGVEMFFAG